MGVVYTFHIALLYSEKNANMLIFTQDYVHTCTCICIRNTYKSLHTYKHNIHMCVRKCNTEKWYYILNISKIHVCLALTGSRSLLEYVLQKKDTLLINSSDSMRSY